MTDDLVAELQVLVDTAARALRVPERYSELDFDLHTKIIESTGNPIYLSLYESIADLLMESRRRTVRTPTVRKQAHKDHLAIVAALRERDAERAGQAMHEHLEGMRLVLDGMLKEEGGTYRASDS